MTNLWPEEGSVMEQTFGEAEKVQERRKQAESTAEVIRYLYSLPREQAAEAAKDRDQLVKLLEDGGFKVEKSARTRPRERLEPSAEKRQCLLRLRSELEQVKDSDRLIELLEGAGFEL